MTSVRPLLGYLNLSVKSSTLEFSRSGSIRNLHLDQTIKKTCLYEYHLERGAKFEPFAGYLMPIQYAGQTIKSEHLHTRNKASLFDVSHMMQTIIEGSDRFKFIEYLTVADVKNLANNRCTLSVMPNENGGIIDDCIIANCLEHSQLFIVSNAGNADKVWSWFNDTKSSDNRFAKMDVRLRRLKGQGLVALQGPKASETLQKHVKENLSDLHFMMTMTTKLGDIKQCRITRCGYTGEDGFEISVEAKDARNLMEMLGQDEEVKPAGLGSRDTLRLEAGLCLHGNDIDETTSPVEAGLTWTIHKGRRTVDTEGHGSFIGSTTILHQLTKEGKPLRRRTGLIATKLVPPARHGALVFGRADGEDQLGVVTSGTFAPTLENNIAMAYLPADISTEYGFPVWCQIRGKMHQYAVTKMPFVPARYYTRK